MIFQHKFDINLKVGLQGIGQDYTVLERLTFYVMWSLFS